ncbi:MAG: transglutaminase domain-containing protein [Clostridia bacterium]|nr:transglutaminase domain-containing protein [Clostridia bacterium]
MDAQSLYRRCQQAQSARETQLRLQPDAAMSNAQLALLLDEALSMVQGRQMQIVRSRGGRCELRLTLHYREGVRMLDAWRNGRTHLLTPEEQSALTAACAVACDAAEDDAAGRTRRVYGVVCQMLRYANTAPGRVGYEKLVGAAGALGGGYANCQGFSDAFFLIGSIAGLTVRHVSGWRGCVQHMWNAVYIGGEWRYADASRGSRLLREGGDAGIVCLRSAAEMRAMGFRWRDEAEKVSNES